MKQTSVRTPDEGELWNNGHPDRYFAVVAGQFVRIGIYALREAFDAKRLEMALDDMWEPKEFRHIGNPSIEGVHEGTGWKLVADDYKAEVEQICTDKLNAWSESFRTAAKAMATQLTRYV